ncbi:MAG: carboxypeptidase regulatory-like domain-containing protein [Bacteroidetes bacterium]|nr:carboxypeptidase regulatory-like domain-containing protein [Bacteroidota bacterium]
MKKTILLSMAALSLLITSCKKPKDGATGATGPAGPVLKGNLQGFIQLYDQYGTRQYFKLDSAAVTIDGSSASVFSDSNGKFAFSDLNTGIYNLSITGRSGYGATKQQNIEITGNGTINKDIRLGQVPTWSVNTITAIDTVVGGNHSLKIRANIAAADTKARQLAIFIGTSSGVSSTNYIWNYTINVPANTTTVNSVVGQTSVFLNGDNLPSGSTIYLVAYPAGVGYQNNSTYLDFNTDLTIYNALNTGNAAIAQVSIQ